MQTVIMKYRGDIVLVVGSDLMEKYLVLLRKQYGSKICKLCPGEVNTLTDKTLVKRFQTLHSKVPYKLVILY